MKQPENEAELAIIVMAAMDELFKEFPHLDQPQTRQLCQMAWLRGRQDGLESCHVLFEDTLGKHFPES